MKSANPAPSAQRRRHFLAQSVALALATAAGVLLVSREGKPALTPDLAMPHGAPTNATTEADLSALARRGQPVPVEHFFSSPENFSHFLELTGNA